MKPAHAPRGGAFERAAGRTATKGHAAEEAEVGSARRVLTARAAVLEAEPCPTRVRARVLAVFAQRGGVLATLARVLFDSWRSPSAATRGSVATRTLRFAASDLLLDVEVSHAAGVTALRLAVEGAHSEAWLSVEDSPRATLRMVRTDATGYAAVRLPRGLRAVVVRVLVYGQERLRTPEIQLS